MPFLLLCALALTVGLVVGLVAWKLGRTPPLEGAQKVGETIGRHASLRAILDARLDPTTATGLALTLALVFAIGGGVLLGVLAYLVRTNSRLIRFDSSVAKWGNAHATAVSTHGLNAVTWLGSIYVVIGLAVLLAVVTTIAERTVWPVTFIVAVVGGEEILVLTVKQVVDRLRPTFNPAAATLRPAFPSGHSATAAAFYATAALLLGRHRSRRTRAVLAGSAAGIAVGVAASRVLLDLHWLTDVIAGLALGWGWFAVCAIAFGGRILRFGAAAEEVAAAAESEAVKVPRDVRQPLS
jgi:membrane-associated phospholipid phosphatase